MFTALSEGAVLSKIGFLHTAKVHVEAFNTLVRTFDATIEVEHMVAEQLLEDSLLQGITDEVRIGIDMALETLAARGCRAIACTCSTLGSAVENRVVDGVKVQRIDRAVGNQLMGFERALVIAALESAAKAADLLLEESARFSDSQGRWLVVLVPGSWALFESGDLDAYYETIASFVNELSDDYDAVFLSQASMQGAAAACSHHNVLTSPAPGIKRLIESLDTDMTA